MDPAFLQQARDYAFVPDRNTQGVVVVHGGAIVAEWYAPGADKDSWGASWSVGKSFASALIGIAIGEGLIPSIDVPISNYYPDWVGTPRESITLRHVLHQETGLDWDEEYDITNIASSEIIMMVAGQPDQLAFAASRPALVAPGTRFNYSSGNSMLLSGVIEQATGKRADVYAREKLLDPIGIGQFEWWRDAANHTLTYCCVDTTSRNFARFGLLYLRGGTWGSQQVVPASWVDASITDTASTYGGYGYQWWLGMASGGPLPPHYVAAGHDGQYIYVFPSLDLVVVRNGTYAKSACSPVADPNLVSYYPPSGLIPGQGTTPPSSWSDEQFLGPIIESFTDGSAAASGAAPGSGTEASSAAMPRGAQPFTAGVGKASPQASLAPAADLVPCPTTTPATTPTTTPTTTPIGSATTAPAGQSSVAGSGRAASTTSAVPRFTG